MRHLRSKLIALHLGGWLLGACYESGTRQAPESEAGAPPPLTEASYVTRYVEAETDFTQGCCMQNGYAGLADDFAASVERGLDEDAPLPEAGARFDPEAAAECLAWLGNRDCSELLKQPHRVRLGCDRVYTRGHRRLGETCRSTFDCALSNGQPTSCEVTRVTRDGFEYSCARYVEVGEGESCTSDDPMTARYCVSGLLCDERLGVCVHLAARGEPCMTGPTWGDTCEVGSVCDWDGTQRCVEPTPVGAACAPGGNLCEGAVCRAGTCREPLFWTSSWYCRE